MLTKRLAFGSGDAIVELIVDAFSTLAPAFYYVCGKSPAIAGLFRQTESGCGYEKSSTLTFSPVGFFTAGKRPSL